MNFEITKFPVSDDNQQLKDEKGLLVNYRITFMKALSSDIGDDGGPVRGEDKFKRYDLYLKFKASTNLVDLTAEDIVLCKKAALNAFPSVVAGQCRDFLSKPLPGA